MLMVIAGIDTKPLKSGFLFVSSGFVLIMRVLSISILNVLNG